MNDIENYKSIVENIFCQEFDIPISGNTNKCIGALNRSDSFVQFKINFIDRLKRLYNYFAMNQSVIKKILVTLKNIGMAKGYQWSGGYSEIVALDYWIQFDNLLNIDYQIKDKAAIFNNSIAKSIGQAEVDLDISLDFSSFKGYMDVKSFKPTHIELANKIFEILKTKTPNDDYLIGIDDIYDVDYLELNNDLKEEISKGNLINELKNCVTLKETHYTHTLRSGRQLNIRIAYPKKGGGTLLLTTRSVNPYRLAMNYKYKILDYYNKLLNNQACFIIFVINPWFNDEINDFSSNNIIFYRALTRRIFIELINDKQNIGNIVNDLAGTKLTVSDIVSLISGIIFIEDKSITLTGNDIYNVYFYANPNAKNRKLDRYDFEILRWSHYVKQPTVIEDFEFDNY